MSFPNAWGSLRERGGGGGGGCDGHLFWIVLLVGVGLNSSGDPGRGSSCCVIERGWTVSGAKWRGRWLVLEGVRGRGMDWA